MTDGLILTLSLVSIGLGLIAGTLAVVSLIFGWRMFLKSTDMQVKAEAALSTISEKVGVVVDSSIKHTDKLLDRFAGLSTAAPPPDLEEKIKAKVDEVSEELRKNAKAELSRMLESLSIGADASNVLVPKMEEFIAESSKRTTEVYSKERLRAAVVTKIAHIQDQLRLLVEEACVPLPSLKGGRYLENLADLFLQTYKVEYPFSEKLLSISRGYEVVSHPLASEEYFVELDQGADEMMLYLQSLLNRT